MCVCACVCAGVRACVRERVCVLEEGAPLGCACLCIPIPFRNMTHL